MERILFLNCGEVCFPYPLGMDGQRQLGLICRPILNEI